VVANYSRKCVNALVFKLGYPWKLLWKSSITFILVTRVETGAVCKLLDKKLQQGTVLWPKLIFQVTGNHEAGIARELFDQIHHTSSYSFRDSFIFQLEGGLHTSLKVCVAAKKSDGESHILLRRLTCMFAFLSISTSKLCDDFLKQETRFFLLNLSLWCIASGDAFTWAFSWLPEGPSSPSYSGNEYRSGWEKFLVEVVKLKVPNVVINVGLCFYGYLRWKFRLVPPGLWNMESVKMQVQWVVPVYMRSGDDNILDQGFPNASVVLTCEWLRESPDAHGGETSSMIDFV
ncbi:hypothetical protein MKW92_005465, partial [Papaver armeniacum]